MDYVEGETLASHTRAMLTVDEATRIIYDVARALACAHQGGVIHRNLSPCNVIIESKTGRAKVTDFGIARAAAGPDVDGAPPAAGRAPFMSPEQLRGEPGDERSDLYPVGVTGYYAVARVPPFEGDTVQEIARKHALEPEPTLAVYNARLVSTYSTVIETCLRKDPGDRYQNAEALCLVLRLAPELSRLTTPQLREFVTELRAYADRTAGSALLFMVALMALVFGLWWPSGRWSRSAVRCWFSRRRAAGIPCWRRRARCSKRAIRGRR